MKFLNYEYNEEDNREKTKSQCLDYLKINEDLALEN